MILQLTDYVVDSPKTHGPQTTTIFTQIVCSSLAFKFGEGLAQVCATVIYLWLHFAKKIDVLLNFELSIKPFQLEIIPPRINSDQLRTRIILRS
jgi:hypothetical protein